MPELKAYSCDAGCGAHVMMTYITDSPANHGWYTTFGPVGTPTVYTCSARCNLKSAERAAANEQEALTT